MENNIYNKAVTYSLLSHISNSGILSRGPLDIFIPIVKKALHFLYSGRNGEYKSNKIDEIRDRINIEYGIDIPKIVLLKILKQIALDVNTEREYFQVFNDGAFWIKDFIFVDFDEQIEEAKINIKNLQNLFMEFCKIQNIDYEENNCVIRFIEKHKLSMSKYLSHKNTIPDNKDFLIAANFINFFKENGSIFYEQIKRIYLGSVLSMRLDYEPNIKDNNIQLTLLLDTNFIVSLIDLNTKESTYTCNTLLDICKKLNASFYVLPETIEEIKKLLYYKSETLDDVMISKYINEEDIYRACERRNLSKVDLDRIADNIEDILSQKRINIVGNTDKLKNKAKYSEDYKNLKKVRNTDLAALHDAMALIYVREKRGNKIRDFEKVNCWFVNNSFSQESMDNESNIQTNNYQPESIKVDDLLNILWLSSPVINKSINNNELSDIGLTSLIAFSLNESLPTARIIRELDSNIEKYAKEEITEKDIHYLSIRVTSRQLNSIDVEELNKLAKTNSSEFNIRLKDEVKKQEEIEKRKSERFEQVILAFNDKMQELDSKKEELEQIKKKTEEISLIKINEALQKTIQAEEENNKINKIREEEKKERKLLKDTINEIDKLTSQKERLEEEREQSVSMFKYWVVIILEFVCFGILLIGIVYYLFIYKGDVTLESMFSDNPFWLILVGVSFLAVIVRICSSYLSSPKIIYRKLKKEQYIHWEENHSEYHKILSRLTDLENTKKNILDKTDITTS
ncbi:MAG: hypothetical protein LBV43_01520 [Prevotella sp.]|jgi:hypothetical protein|nr:hypothetical protein [Prevotella sp.]